MKHTKEPWRIGDAGQTVFGPPNGKPSPETIVTGPNGGLSYGPNPNIQRIVACVNALAELENPAAIESVLTVAILVANLSNGLDHVSVPNNLLIRLRDALAALAMKEG